MFLKFIQMIEKERKFILLEMPKTDISIELKQAYLMFEGMKHLRVRIINNEKAYIAFKDIKTPCIKIEYEYEIPLKDAIEMFNSSCYRVEKIRHKTMFDGNCVDIDVYPNGLSVVEIEYETELVSIPNYCGEEVTGISEYSNIGIAIKNKIQQ